MCVKALLSGFCHTNPLVNFRRWPPRVSRVEHVSAVGGRDNDDAGGALEVVNLVHTDHLVSAPPFVSPV